MTRESPTTSRAAPLGRPRDPDADGAIIKATLEIIAEQGYDGIRMAAVAERAGVSKATMYRRWASKTDLVVAALQSAPPLSAVDTGSLRSDLLSLLGQFLEVAASAPIAGLLAALAAERQKDPQLGEALDPFVAARIRPLVQAFERAIAREEVDADLDIELVLSMIGGSLVLRLFFGGTTDSASLERLVDLMLRSLAHG